MLKQMLQSDEDSTGNEEKHLQGKIPAEWATQYAFNWMWVFLFWKLNGN